MTQPQQMERPENAAQARDIQEALRHRVRIADEFLPPALIAGIDVSYDMRRDMSLAFIVLMTPGDLKPLEWVKAELPTPFPYVPGLLSFREIPVILRAFEKLPRTPDLLMVDGQGISHPRRLGIAAHLGVLLDMPSIGVAKSRLVGQYAEPGLRKGDRSPLVDKGELIGTVLRSRDDTLPLFVSPGHRVGQESAVALTLACLTRYRLPEPTRIADKLSKHNKYEEGNLLLA